VKYSVEGNDTEFTTEFLKKYMSLGFSNLPKKEIDILVFGLLSKYGYLEGSDYYSIAKELMIEERKVKRLILDNSLRTEKNTTLMTSMKSINRKIFVDKLINPEIDEKTITIMIDNPIEKRDYIYALRCVGYSFDENLNPERITLPIYVFITVLCRYDDDFYSNFKKMAKDRIKEEKEYEKAFIDSKPLIERVKSVIDSASVPIGTISAIASLF